MNKSELIAQVAKSAGITQKEAQIDSVEIKVTVRPDQEQQALRSLNIKQERAQQMQIYFFDTPSLALFEGRWWPLNTGTSQIGAKTRDKGFKADDG
jgi:hypothetical protein